MKLLFILAFSVLMQISNNTPQIEEKGTLSVELKNVQVQKGGQIYIAVFNKKETFMTENRYKGVIVNVDQETASAKVSFEDLPHGDYVISAFHDTNGNGKMDFDGYGRPAEAWATSGKPNPYGAPTWEATKIQLSGKLADVILDFGK